MTYGRGGPPGGPKSLIVSHLRTLFLKKISICQAFNLKKIKKNPPSLAGWGCDVPLLDRDLDDSLFLFRNLGRQLGEMSRALLRP